MFKRINLLLLSLLVTAGVLCYLTFHHFSLKVGESGGALCAISATINCDAASTSPYAEIFGIPIAILGAVLNGLIFCFVLFYFLGWSEPSSNLKITLRGLLGFTVVNSVVYGIISFFILKVTCPYCFATYVLSAINLALGWNLIATDKNDKFDFSLYFSEFKTHTILVALVPAFSWMINGMLLDSYQLSDLRKHIPEKISIWKNGKIQNFDINIGIKNKIENPKHTLVEFADFKCPHCKAAANTIEVFLKGHKDISYVYKPFPLDGTCNEAFTQKGDGSRCDLAALALCADTKFNKGLETVHWIFENQIELFTITDVKSQMDRFEKELGFDKTILASCMTSEETFRAIKQSAGEGIAAKVEGTPAIFLNGKLLPLGQVLDVLQAAVND